VLNSSAIDIHQEANYMTFLNGASASLIFSNFQTNRKIREHQFFGETAGGRFTFS
jgi:hypothetical protein